MNQEMIDIIAKNMHHEKQIEKEKQGFHAPYYCNSKEASKAHYIDNKSFGHFGFLRSYKYCTNCCSDMYPYKELSEKNKEHYRSIVKLVISSIKKVIL